MFKCIACVKGRGEKINELREIKEMIMTNQELMQNLQKNIKEQVNKAVDSKIADVKSKQNTLETKLVESDAKNEERFLTIENELKNKQDKVTNVQTKEATQKLEGIIQDFRENESSMEMKIKEEVKMYLDSQNEKDRKKNNVIIHRLEETQANDKEQNERDKLDVMKILATTNPELLSEFENSLLEGRKISRLGKREPESTKPRPIRVILRDEDMRNDILQGCCNLKDSIFSHISVQVDYTKEEQKKNFQLRQEVRKRNEDGIKVCLYRGEIINIEDHPTKKQKK